MDCFKNHRNGKELRLITQLLGHLHDSWILRDKIMVEGEEGMEVIYSMEGGDPPKQSPSLPLFLPWKMTAPLWRKFLPHRMRLGAQNLGHYTFGVQSSLSPFLYY